MASEESRNPDESADSFRQLRAERAVGKHGDDRLKETWDLMRGYAGLGPKELLVTCDQMIERITAHLALTLHKRLPYAKGNLTDPAYVRKWLTGFDRHVEYLLLAAKDRGLEFHGFKECTNAICALHDRGASSLEAIEVFNRYYMPCNAGLSALKRALMLESVRDTKGKRAGGGGPTAPPSPATLPANGQPADRKARVEEVPALDDDARLSPAELAKRFNVPCDALRSRLKRLRKTDLACFTEVAQRGSKDPQFLYRVGAVRPIIKALQTISETISETTSETTSK